MMLSTEYNIASAQATSPKLHALKHLAIIAGGKGTRLKPLAGGLPKVLVRIGGKPVLQHQLELAAAAGIEQVSIFAGYLANEIQAFVGNGSRFGLRVELSAEKYPMGNAGALLQSLDSFPNDFIVLYGDVMLAIDLQRVGKEHLARNSDITAMVHPNDHPYDSDLLETDSDGWVTKVHNYPHTGDEFFGNLVNSGIYVVRREALRPWVASHAKVDFAKDLMPRLITGGGRVLAYRSAEYAKDMGTPDRLRQVEADWNSGEIRPDAPRRPRPAIFFDRDGTLNVEKGFLRKHDDLELIPGVGQALSSLRHAGFRLVILTNQPVIARGEASAADVAAIHRKLEWELGKERAYVDAIYTCPHHPDRGFDGERKELKIACRCRKPGTGLFERACEDIPIDVSRSWMVGDQTIDIEMARRAGLRSVLVQTGEAGADGRFPSTPDYVAADALAAANVILQNNQAPAS